MALCCQWRPRQDPSKSQCPLVYPHEARGCWMPVQGWGSKASARLDHMRAGAPTMRTHVPSVRCVCVRPRHPHIQARRARAHRQHPRACRQRRHHEQATVTTFGQHQSRLPEAIQVSMCTHVCMRLRAYSWLCAPVETARVLCEPCVCSGCCWRLALPSTLAMTQATSSALRHGLWGLGRSCLCVTPEAL